jgi:hypothetical protein
MIGSAKQILVLLVCALASSLAAGQAMAGRRALPIRPTTIRYPRRHPRLVEQEPPSWLTTLARTVLVLATATLVLTTLLACDDC